MNEGVFLFLLAGAVFCGFKIRSAWRGKSGVPIGTIIGGGLLGGMGAGIGGAVAGDDDKRGRKPNIGGVVFWSLCCLLFIGCLFAG